MLSLTLKLILALKCRKVLIRLLFTTLSIYIFNLAITRFANGRLNFKGLFLAHKRPWALIRVGA